MLTLAAGANTPVPERTFETTVAWGTRPGAPAPDVCALLLGADGKVRSDADFVFYNQPTGGNGAVHCPASGTPGRASVRVALDGMPADVARVLVAASTDGRAFAEVLDLRAEVTEVSPAGAAFAAACALTAAGPETVLVLAEFYRRGTAWKLRAVGQGYASGLAGLAQDYGVTVDDDGAGSPSGAPTAPPEPTPPALPPRPSTPPRPHLPPPSAAIPSGPSTRHLPAADSSHLADRALAQRMEQRKRDVAAAMAACGLSGVRARVVVAMDASFDMREITRPPGSVRPVHTLQSAMDNHAAIAALIERLAAVAACAAVDAEAEVWAYVNRYTRLSRKLSVAELPYWHKTDRMQSIRLGFVPNHARVAHDLADTYDAPAGSLPTLILFFTASDITSTTPLTRTLAESAHLPVFWQFVGLGPTPFTTLEQLATAPAGHPLPHTDFLALDAPGLITDPHLYPELFTAYARWLSAAMAAGIARF